MGIAGTFWRALLSHRRGHNGSYRENRAASTRGMRCDVTRCAAQYCLLVCKKNSGLFSAKVRTVVQLYSKCTVHNLHREIQNYVGLREAAQKATIASRYNTTKFSCICPKSAETGILSLPVPIPVPDQYLPIYILLHVIL